MLQVASSLLDSRRSRQDFFPRARELGKTVYGRSIFLQGVAYLDPNTLPSYLSELAEPLHTIRRTARQLGVTTRALFLPFAREFLPGGHPIVGRERDDQLAELLTDWADESLDVAARAPLVDALPTLDATAVEPSKWQPAANSSEMESKVNQTIAGSVATIPR